MKKSQGQSPKGEVRIIAGLWRGRKLPVLNAEGLRPTGDRVKETLFNWLMPYIHQAKCLDGFAGSGSLGIEALSRQAEKVTFLEKDKTVANQLKKNLQTLKCTAEQAQVLNQNCLDFLKQPQNQPHFDVVFIDPPFHFGLAEQAIRLLAENNWLHPNALIYVETEKENHLNTPENWTLLKEKTTGMVSYRLYQN
ncbi:16S rRNA (guanine(966)-N(2))-methyltransferase RsmD [Rodentibacter pneumotropicus]|uniref:Ribosomal RNA small subunit methyltransferase D n=1 Tax=Rodentibacter pneumotropicus TaxID=758 RepID=A0A4S2QBR9_9PAST|nr:16S rRNA (guanine(966)-N(2))-methyltransferase RsmD [Rodentibacter pneumotropicus]THA00110.1 16S rRNA (guanine(966)-N(2))-methyltransferase RsmD [Rodentibacter pneumotropicus]THA00827.1 16S rRNA (guanine(966)-N(2))-methyltransferase RsmD [Rodentibacter pneumotropicus]THA04835.1 16S rRNA (guanine(966)-N(2))-methyltransferase RsmD [Rodentibacter pneumotropicus]THA13467.1 16S rRNA (guanine(966)-N(2))-methyltransferase RsmD [Rodentibacter pneumotropicus]